MKVLSPEMTALGQADGVNGPAGNRPLCDSGECKGPPRGLRPYRALHGGCAVTREIRWSTSKEGRPLGQVSEARKRGKAAGSRRHP